MGLGHCRTAAAAGLLTAQLDKTKSAAEADGIARALGFLSSSWAWRALGKSRHAEGLQVRRMASEALVRAFVRFDGRARTGARVGLTMAEHPDIRSIASLHRGAATTTVIKALDEVLSERLGQPVKTSLKVASTYEAGGILSNNLMVQEAMVHCINITPVSFFNQAN